MFNPSWAIYSLKWQKLAKFLKILPLGGQGGSDQKKNFFQKVITYQDETFVGQTFFSKTNILGFRKILDPLGPQIRKIVQILGFPEFFLNLLLETFSKGVIEAKSIIQTLLPKNAGKCP